MGEWMNMDAEVRLDEMDVELIDEWMNMDAGVRLDEADDE